MTELHPSSYTSVHGLLRNFWQIYDKKVNLHLSVIKLQIQYTPKRKVVEYTLGRKSDKKVKQRRRQIDAMQIMQIIYVSWATT